MPTLPIDVDEATAAAFRDAPPETRDWIARLVRHALRGRLGPGETPLDALDRTMDALGAEAAANGWSPEDDEALLRGDLDRDA